MTAPLPPDDLATRRPDIQTLRTGAVLHRIYTAAFEPIHFDQGRSGRFNAPDSSYGVLYVAKSRNGAFAEVFLRDPGHTMLPPNLLARKAYAQLRTVKPLRLIKLHGPGLARVGATAEVVHGGLPYDVPQAWSNALRAHPSKPDRIAYYARHDDEELCFALFDHAQVAEVSREVDLDQDWFWKIADRYHVGSPRPDACYSASESNDISLNWRPHIPLSRKPSPRSRWTVRSLIRFERSRALGRQRRPERQIDRMIQRLFTKATT